MDLDEGRLVVCICMRIACGDTHAEKKVLQSLKHCLLLNVGSRGRA